MASFGGIIYIKFFILSVLFDYTISQLVCIHGMLSNYNLRTTRMCNSPAIAKQQNVSYDCFLFKKIFIKNDTWKDKKNICFLYDLLWDSTFPSHSSCSYRPPQLHPLPHTTLIPATSTRSVTLLVCMYRKRSNAVFEIYNLLLHFYQRNSGEDLGTHWRNRLVLEPFSY